MWKICKTSIWAILRIQIKFRIRPNEYSFDEKDIASALQVAFEEEIIHSKYCAINKNHDFYFSEHKLGLEIDKYGHPYRDFEYEQSRQLMIEKNH